MNCADCNRLLNAYLDGEVDAPAALAIDEHLQTCGRCRRAFEGLQATSSVLSRHCAAGPTPPGLRSAVQIGTQQARIGWRGLLHQPWTTAVPGILALALALWIAVQPAPDTGNAVASATLRTRVVYHLSNSDHAGAVLRNLSNHLAADPHARIVVVAHNAGVDFLLRGAKDEMGRPFAADVQGFTARGVEFRVCNNTLERRHIAAAEVIREAALVPSGIAEIGRLQSREGYIYMRF